MEFPSFPLNSKSIETARKIHWVLKGIQNVDMPIQSEEPNRVILQLKLKLWTAETDKWLTGMCSDSREAH